MAAEARIAREHTKAKLLDTIQSMDKQASKILNFATSQTDKAEQERWEERYDALLEVIDRLTKQLNAYP